MNDKETSKRFQTFLIFGAPGSGKGTQGIILGTIPRFYHCSCGEVFRSIDTRTPIGMEFLKYSSKGELVPDTVTVDLWNESIESRVASNVFKPDIDFLVLDGIPRNPRQAEIMEAYIDVIQVFHLSCPDRGELSRRLKKRAIKDNRLDDANDDVIKNRLQVYENESKPVLDYYSSSIVNEIDASQPPVKVLSDILGAIMALDAWQDISVLKV